MSRTGPCTGASRPPETRRVLPRPLLPWYGTLQAAPGAEPSLAYYRLSSSRLGGEPSCDCNDHVAEAKPRGPELVSARKQFADNRLVKRRRRFERHLETVLAEFRYPRGQRFTDALQLQDDAGSKRDRGAAAQRRPRGGKKQHLMPARERPDRQPRCLVDTESFGLRPRKFNAGENRHGKDDRIVIRPEQPDRCVRISIGRAVDIECPVCDGAKGRKQQRQQESNDECPLHLQPIPFAALRSHLEFVPFGLEQADRRRFYRIHCDQQLSRVGDNRQYTSARDPRQHDHRRAKRRSVVFEST